MKQENKNSLEKLTKTLKKLKKNSDEISSFELNELIDLYTFEDIKGTERDFFIKLGICAPKGFYENCFIHYLNVELKKKTPFGHFQNYEGNTDILYEGL